MAKCGIEGAGWRGATNELLNDFEVAYIMRAAICDLRRKFSQISLQDQSGMFIFGRDAAAAL